MRQSSRAQRRRNTLLIPAPLAYAGLLAVAAIVCLALVTSLAALRGDSEPGTVQTLRQGAGSTADGIVLAAETDSSDDSLPKDTISALSTATSALAADLILPAATPTAAPTVTPTAPPTPTPTVTPTATPEPFTLEPLPANVTLDGFRHMWQTWNNCGPATLAMNLSYYGSSLDQATVGADIRTHAEDKNVNVQELVEYARQQGFMAQARVNGDGDLLRSFISQGIPVLIETWLQPEPNDGFGHYRLLTGYDEANQRWIAHDSYVAENLVNPDPASYAGIYLPYAETDRFWAVYNRTYLLIYPPEQADTVNAILGENADPTRMWEGALDRAEAEIAAQQAAGEISPFPWFNKGSALYQLGRAEEAAAAFDQARAIGLPWRMLWYQFDPFATYYAVGRFQDLVDLARTTLATTSSLEEVQYWYGMGLAALGDTAGARQAWEYALQMKPSLQEARTALENLGG